VCDTAPFLFLLLQILPIRTQKQSRLKNETASILSSLNVSTIFATGDSYQMPSASRQVSGEALMLRISGEGPRYSLIFNYRIENPSIPEC